MRLCQVCGNEIAAGTLVCRFCGSYQNQARGCADSRAGFRKRVVNIERGMPMVETALHHLQIALDEAKREQVRVVTVIHGYGSSGTGGVIRDECRKTLGYMYSRGEIKGYIAGEEFSRRKGETKALLRRYPKLTRDRNLNRGNPGITLVIL